MQFSKPKTLCVKTVEVVSRLTDYDGSVSMGEVACRFNQPEGGACFCVVQWCAVREPSIGEIVNVELLQFEDFGVPVWLLTAGSMVAPAGRRESV